MSRGEVESDVTSRMSPVVINARFLTQATTGVQRFAECVSVALKAALPGAVFVSPRDVINHGVANALGVIQIGTRRGHAWEQFDLPRYLWSSGSPLLLNLGNTGPVVYSNQVATLHDIAFIRNPESFSWMFRNAYKLMSRVLLARSRALLTVSEFSKGEISSYFGADLGKIFVVPNAVDARFARRVPRVLAARPYLLAVSSPSAHKNFSRVIEAYSRWGGCGAVDLLIVGGQVSSFATQQFGELPSGVRFLGRVSDDELIDLYSGAVAFVFPSLYEGFGIPPLEAQACGCAVMASNAASIPEVLGDSAFYFDPLDTDGMAQAMDAVVSDGVLRGELIKRGRANVERFSWSSSAQIVAQVLRGLK